MARWTVLACVLLISPLTVLGGVVHSVLAPFSVSFPTVTKTVVPVVQKYDSYSSYDSSNSEVRDLLRSLLSEIRNSRIEKSHPITIRDSYTVQDSYGPPPKDSYGPPPSSSYGPPADSYGPPPKPSRAEKVVLVQEKQVASVSAAPFAAAVAIAGGGGGPVAVKDVRTVYQPVYVPYQYAPQYAPQYVSVAQPALATQSVAVPTAVKTGASAVAYSTIHHSPAYAIQQQQVPVVQEQYATLVETKSEPSW